MLIWISLLLSAGFAWLVTAIGFFELYVLFFNVVLSLYLGISAAPLLAKLIPATGAASYGVTLAILIISGGIFLLLNTVSSIFFTSRFRVEMPRIFQTLFAGILAFITGMMILSFVSFLFLTTPLSGNSLVNRMGVNRQTLRPNVKYLCFWCDLLDCFVGSSSAAVDCEDLIAQLVDRNAPQDEPSGDTTEPKAAKAPIQAESNPLAATSATDLQNSDVSDSETE